MRQAYAHSAVLQIAGAGDDLVARLRPHHTTVTRDGDRLTVRILFAAAPGQVDEVRDQIDATLAAGDWQLISSGCARIEGSDRDDARRLLKSG